MWIAWRRRTINTQRRSERLRRSTRWTSPVGSSASTDQSDPSGRNDRDAKVTGSSWPARRANSPRWPFLFECARREALWWSCHNLHDFGDRAERARHGNRRLGLRSRGLLLAFPLLLLIVT